MHSFRLKTRFFPNIDQDSNNHASTASMDLGRINIRFHFSDVDVHTKQTARQPQPADEVKPYPYIYMNRNRLALSTSGSGSNPNPKDEQRGTISEFIGKERSSLLFPDGRCLGTSNDLDP